MSQDITPDFVRELLGKITPGEWVPQYDFNKKFDNEIHIIKDGHTVAWQELITKEVGIIDEDDANFIAAAPRIAEAYLELAEENKRLREALESAVSNILQMRLLFLGDTGQLASVVDEMKKALAPQASDKEDV